MQVLGNQQSPVKIETAKTFPIEFGSDYLQFHYSGPLAGKFQGNNFEITPPSDPDKRAPWSILVGETEWIIRKIHIHNPAEHLLNSRRHRLYEVHLVHSALDDPAAKGDKLVVAVFVVEDAEAHPKKTLRELNEKLGARKEKDGTPDCAVDHKLDPSEFLPEDGYREKWFRYEGSLTSWPYSEDVTWILFNDHARVKREDFEIIAGCAKQERRPVFDLNRRIVLRSFE